MKFAVLGMLSIVAGAIGFAWFVSQEQRKNRRKLLIDRDSLSDDAILSRYFADAPTSERQIISAWHAVADALYVSSGLLRPDDKFADLSGLPMWFISYDSDLTDTGGLLDYIYSVSRSEKIEEKDLSTIGDAVRILAPYR